MFGISESSSSKQVGFKKVIEMTDWRLLPVCVQQHLPNFLSEVDVSVPW